MSKNPLLALTAAACALPGIEAGAQQISEDFQFGYRFHAYEEDAISQDQAIGNSFERYDIDVNQFRLVAPISESMQLTADYQHEKMSGASPWYTILDSDGNPVQVMSGASIEDQRKDAALSLKSVTGQHSVSVTAAISDEDDYRSNSYALGYSFESEDKLSTYSVSADVSNDDINAVDADLFPTRPSEQQSKRSNSVLLSYARVVNKSTLVNLSVGYSRKNGYLSDPYKMVLVDFNLIGDTRPDSRNTRTFAAQLRYFSDSLNGSLHADYRFYDDSWDIRSHTVDLSWYQNIGWGVQLIPSVRLYSQDAAFFYENFYQQSRSDGYYSTDYRLSEYGAVTYGLKLIKQFENWSLTASADKYSSGGSKGFADADVENPALIDFELYTLGVNFVF